MNSLMKLAASAAYVSAASLGDDEEEEDDEEGEEAAPVEPTPKKAKRTKKVEKSKKVVKASSKGSKNGDKNTIRLKDLARQAKLTEAIARKKLRDAEVPRGEGRWSWELGSKALKQARKALGLAV